MTVFESVLKRPFVIFAICVVVIGGWALWSDNNSNRLASEAKKLKIRNEAAQSVALRREPERATVEPLRKMFESFPPERDLSHWPEKFSLIDANSAKTVTPAQTVMRASTYERVQPSPPTPAPITSVVALKSQYVGSLGVGPKRQVFFELDRQINVVSVGGTIETGWILDSFKEDAILIRHELTGQVQVIETRVY